MSIITILVPNSWLAYIRSVEFHDVTLNASYS